MSELLPFDVSPVEPDELTVQVGAGDDEPERLLAISRPVDGVVRLREWSSESWNTPPRERTLAAGELLQELERAARRRRRLSEELHRLRLWLTDGV